MSEPRLQILKAGLLYFALVFGAGFALGTLRVALILAALLTVAVITFAYAAWRTP